MASQWRAGGVLLAILGLAGVTAADNGPCPIVPTPKQYEAKGGMLTLPIRDWPTICCRGGWTGRAFARRDSLACFELALQHRFNCIRAGGLVDERNRPAPDADIEAAFAPARQAHESESGPLSLSRQVDDDTAGVLVSWAELTDETICGSPPEVRS